MKRVIIIGGGAAGMMASVRYAERGFDVLLIEKNEKLGKKLFITGKGRCNLTNDCTADEFFSHVISNPKFLFSAYFALTAQDTMERFREWGLELKTERGQRVFPVSDHSYDVTDTLKKRMKKLGVRVLLNTAAEDLVLEKNEEENSGNLPRVVAVKAGGKNYPADRVLIATGGLSYPVTGSTGDGLRWAEKTGHQITECLPSLVAMSASDHDIAQLQGLALKNVSFTVLKNKKVLYDEFGEMLFTHFGISGPLVLTASSRIGRELRKGELQGVIDLKPAVSSEKLNANLLRLFEENPNKNILHAIRSLYPASLLPVILDRAGVAAHKKVHDITKEERNRIREVTKNFRVHLTGLRGFEEAIITKGGISIRNVNPSTMESRKVRGLYFAGEVLDVDALTGGFNLQIAWSTAWAAADA